MVVIVEPRPGACRSVEERPSFAGALRALGGMGDQGRAAGTADWQVGSLASESVVWLLQMTILVAFFALSLVAGHRLSLRAYSEPRTAGRALMPMAVLSLLFTAAGVVLLNLPMGMRHGMRSQQAAPKRLSASLAPSSR